MSVAVKGRTAFQSGTPRPLFQFNIVGTGIRTGPISWEIAPKGNRFLIISPNTSDTPALNLALNSRVETVK